MIRLLRVDHRLLHGQVAFSWTNALGADCILIANDEVPKDSLRSSTLKLAKPQGVKLVIKSIEDSIAAINSGVTDKYKLFIITENITDAHRIVSSCSAISKINLGQAKVKENAKQISKAIFVTDEEVLILKELIEKGKEIVIQQVPTERGVKAEDVL